MRIYCASDHAGFELKKDLIAFVETLGHEAIDVGAPVYNECDDYPDFIVPAARKVAEDTGSFGIVIGGSGQGEAIAANKIAGIRAALYYGGNMNIVTLAREHNNANVLSLGARFVSPAEARKAVRIWLETPFSEGERHIRRLQKIDEIVK